LCDIPFNTTGMMEATAHRAARFRLYPVWIGLGCLLVGLVVYFSLAPLPEVKGMEFPFADKVGHFFAYGFLTLWFGQVFKRKSGSLLIACGLAALGVVLEFLQATTGYRTFEVSDMAANTAGATVGLLLSWTRAGNLLFLLEAILSGIGGRGTLWRR
jgi:VanZ family protein